MANIKSCMISDLIMRTLLVMRFHLIRIIIITTFVCLVVLIFITFASLFPFRDKSEYLAVTVKNVDVTNDCISIKTDGMYSWGRCMGFTYKTEGRSIIIYPYYCLSIRQGFVYSDDYTIKLKCNTSNVDKIILKNGDKYKGEVYWSRN